MILAAGEVTQEAEGFLQSHGTIIYYHEYTGIHILVLPETARIDNYWGVADIIRFEQGEEMATEGVEVHLEQDVKKIVMRYTELVQMSPLVEEVFREGQ